MNTIYLKQEASAEELKSGKVKGVAYTGAVIKEHGFLKNLVIDMSTLKVAKAKTPLLRDHNPTQIAGHVGVDIGEQVTFEGTLSKKTSYGSEILELSEEDFPWEVSMGIFGGELQEFENGHFNGQDISHGIALVNGTIREISLLALGADGETTAEVFNVKPKSEVSMVKLTQEQWEKFACACGGNKESKPEDLEAKFAEGEEKAEELKKEVAALKEEIAKKEAEIAALTEKEETAVRQASLESAAKEKGLELGSEELAVAAKTKASTDILLKVIGSAKPMQKLIDSKLAGKTDLGEADQTDKNDENALRLAAEKLVTEGKAKNFLEAINMVEGK